MNTAESKFDLKKEADSYFNGENDAVKEFIKLTKELKTLEKEVDPEEYVGKKLVITNFIPTIRGTDFVHPRPGYLLGLIKGYRKLLIEFYISHSKILQTFSYDSEESLDEFIKKIADRVKKFSGRKTDDFRLEVRSYAIKQKEELLQNGKSNRAANAIIIDRLEQHPEYSEYVGTLGKEALRKLLQLPKADGEKNTGK